MTWSLSPEWKSRVDDQGMKVHLNPKYILLMEAFEFCYSQRLSSANGSV
jgi:hypothetical protein